MAGLVTKLALAWLERGRARKRFQGTLFDRFRGLEPVLARCRGCSVLDVGAGEGLVAYELARHGAAVVHGIELDGADVAFARRLFRDVPVESRFWPANLAHGPRVLERLAAEGLRERYDVVLYLGVHHHLVHQASPSLVEALLRDLIARAASLLVVRTPRLEAVEPAVLAAGFRTASASEGDGTIGPLRVYERTQGPASP